MAAAEIVETRRGFVMLMGVRRQREIITTNLEWQVSLRIQT